MWGGGGGAEVSLGDWINKSKVNKWRGAWEKRWVGGVQEAGEEGGGHGRGSRLLEVMGSRRNRENFATLCNIL